MGMVLVWAAIICGFIVGIWQYVIKPLIEGVRAQKEAEAEYNRWINRHNGYGGIHLSEEQIQKLEAGTELPHLPAAGVPVVLSAGEIAVYHVDAEIVKNDYFFGELVITTKRVVFVGEEKGFDFQNNKISSFLCVDGAIMIQSGRSIYKLELDAPYIAKATFDGVTCRRIPISSLAASDRPYAHGRGRIDDVEKVVTLDNMSIDGMEGHEFEHFCADLLLKTGFDKADVTPGSGDQGVDIVAVKDGLRYAIQCKNYTSPLSNTPVQEVNAGKDYYNCHVAAVMTNSTFTPGAQKLADANRVLLWDGVYVKNLMEKAGMQDFLIPNQQAEDCVITFDPEDSNNVQTTVPLQNNDCIITSTDTDEYYNATELYESDTQLIQENEDINNAELFRPKKRRGMAIWSKICLGWSILCFLIFIGGLVAGSQEEMTVGLGEGLFVLVLGLMFAALAKTEKGNPYIYLGGKSIKKYVFVILCIVIAYILFIGTIGITGGLNLTIS